MALSRPLLTTDMELNESAGADRPGQGMKDGVSDLTHLGAGRSAQGRAGTQRAIICVLTQPGDLAPEGQSYLSAGYVKWLEAAGARVLPVLYDMSDDEITKVFGLCNGVLFPGGNHGLGTDSKWFKAAELLYRLVLEANSQGQVLPLVGTCLGLQLLATIVTRDQYALVPLEAANHPAPIRWSGIGRSRFINLLPISVIDDLQMRPIAMHNHHYGLVDESFDTYPALRDTFDILAHSRDWTGRSYVSVMEGRAAPLLGLAFHPEKVPYEWTLDLDVPHSAEATAMAFHLGAAFTALARQNSHSAQDVMEEERYLIYNFNPVYSGRHSTPEQQDLPFEQVYLFDLKEHPAVNHLAQA